MAVSQFAINRYYLLEMKSFLLILTIIFTSSLQAERINLDNYFDVVNRTLKIHKLSNTEFLLYGDKGGVVRSYDAGETWEQNYAATKSNIVSMVNHKGFVVGATTNGELIYSTDKGNHWDLKITDIKPTKMVANSDLLFATEGNSNIFISSDMGESWIGKSVTDFPINELLFLKEKLFVSTQNYELHYSSDLGDSWSKIELPEGMNGNQQHFLQIDDEELYIRGIASIYKVNDNLSFDEIINNSNFSRYIISGDSIHYFVGNPSSRKFEYRNQKINESEVVTHFDYHNPSYHPSSYALTDVTKSDSILIMTFFGKGIVRSGDYGKTWEIVSHYPLFENYRDFKFVNKDEWNFNGQYFSLNTYNEGATFEPGLDFTIDTTNNSEFKSFIRSNYWITEDSVVYFLAKQYNNSLLANYYVSGDRGRTLIPSSKEIRDDLIVITHSNDTIFSYLDFYNFERLGDDYKIYAISNGFEIDSVNNIDSIASSGLLIPISWGGKTYLCYEKVLDEEGNVAFIIDYTEDNFKTIKNIVSRTKLVGERTMYGSIFGSENGYLYFSFLKDKNYFSYRLNLETNIVKNIDENRTLRPFILKDKQYANNEIQFSHYEELDIEADTIINKYRQIRINITETGDIIQDTLHENLPGKVLFNVQAEIVIYGGQSMLRPIEEDRLTSVTVENDTEVIGIWPFFPYPNPAKGRISIQFYTEMSENIANLEIELINISTGVNYQIEDYNIQFMNNWDGTIDFDISNYPSGSYLINMRLGEYQKSTKLMIVR